MNTGVTQSQRLFSVQEQEGFLMAQRSLSAVMKNILVVLAFNYITTLRRYIAALNHKEHRQTEPQSHTHTEHSDLCDTADHCRPKHSENCTDILV